MLEAKEETLEILERELRASIRGPQRQKGIQELKNRAVAVMQLKKEIQSLQVSSFHSL